MTENIILFAKVTQVLLGVYFLWLVFEREYIHKHFIGYFALFLCVLFLYLKLGPSPAYPEKDLLRQMEWAIYNIGFYWLCITIFYEKK